MRVRSMWMVRVGAVCVRGVGVVIVGVVAVGTVAVGTVAVGRGVVIVASIAAILC